jgi:hypothetical protein
MNFFFLVAPIQTTLCPNKEEEEEEEEEEINALN